GSPPSRSKRCRRKNGEQLEQVIGQSGVLTQADQRPPSQRLELRAQRARLRDQPVEALTQRIDPRLERTQLISYREDGPQLLLALVHLLLEVQHALLEHLRLGVAWCRSSVDLLGLAQVERMHVQDAPRAGAHGDEELRHILERGVPDE